MDRSTRPPPALAAACVALCGALLATAPHAQPSPDAAASAAPRRERPPIVVAPDRRIPIVPTAEARARTLADMRAYLAGLQSMFLALARNDPADAARTARELAALAPADVPLASPSPFEADFRALGVRLREDFGRIAGDGEPRRDVRQTAGRLGIATQTCVACHQTFQLNEVFAAPARQGSAEQAAAVGAHAAAAHPDPRTPLLARPNGRAYVLRSMRTYLAGLQAMLVALSQDDWATVGETAGALAAIDLREVALSARDRADPAAFRSLAHEAQRALQAVAEGARTRDTGATLGQIGAALRPCVACHRDYRLDDAPRSALPPAPR